MPGQEAEQTVQLGKKIKRLREAKKWSQKQLADAVDVVPSYISHLEAGTRTRPSATLIENIASKLDPAECNDLLWTAGYAPRDNVPVDLLNATIRRLSSAQQDPSLDQILKKAMDDSVNNEIGTWTQIGHAQSSSRKRLWKDAETICNDH